MLREFVSGPLSEATEIVAHNGDRFDLPWIRGRCLIHSLPMAPTYPTVDTLKKARQKFRLPSNRLDYLGDTLIGEQKLATGFGLWRDIVLDKSEPAMKKMVRYCKQDVVLLEKVFERMKPYIESASSVAEYARDCRECGSSSTYINARRVRASGALMFDMQCYPCGKHHTLSEGQYDKNKRFATA